MLEPEEIFVIKIRVGEINMTEQMVTITRKEYDRLTKDSEFLSCLESCGVDNWDGYGDAQEMMDDEE